MQGNLTITEMCQWLELSRLNFYRHWQQQAPEEEETALRDRLQSLSVAPGFYGYRRLTALLRREGITVNHKRVLRLMREDNLLCLRTRKFALTTDANHGWGYHPNLAAI